MGEVLNNIQSALHEAQKKRQQNETCGYDNSGPGDIFYATVFTNTQPGTRYNWTQGTNPDKLSGQTADIPINLPFPCRKFRLVSVIQGSTTALQVFLSLQPTGLSYTGGGTFVQFPTGQENWFPMQQLGVSSTANQEQSLISLKNKTNLIYLTCAEGNGTQAVFTIACYNDAIDDETKLGSANY